jgi:hypothetical protein
MIRRFNTFRDSTLYYVDSSYQLILPMSMSNRLQIDTESVRIKRRERSVAVAWPNGAFQRTVRVF